MDPRVIYLLASKPPEERLAIAQQNGWPLELLHQIEMAAEANGIELVGGPATSAGGGSGGGSGGGAPAPSWSEEVSVSLEVLWSTTRAKLWGYGGVAVFFLAVPFALYMAKSRRGLSWAALLEQGLRLPFSD